MKTLAISILLTLITPLVSAQEGEPLYPLFNNLISEKNLRIVIGPTMHMRDALLGHKIMFGGQFCFAEPHAFDLRFSTSNITIDRYFDNNPHWEYWQESTGLELVIEYNFIMHLKNIRFYPSLGPSFRYSHERHVYNKEVRLDPTGQFYDFYYDVKEDTGWRVGYEFALNADFDLLNFVTIGPRISVSHFPYGGRHTFLFFGISAVNIFKLRGRKSL